jgi:hypothetical protein
MEYVVALILISAVGYFLWDYNQTKKADLTGKHPLDGATKPQEPKTVHVVDVASAPPAEAVAIVEQAQEKVKKARKPKAEKAAAPKPKKPRTKKS